MHRKSILALLFSAAILSGCASSGNQPTTTRGQGMLVIGVVLHDMNYAGQVNGGQYAVSALSVKSLDDGQTYAIQLTSNHGMLILPAGTYCVNSLIPQGSAALTYCGQPYFKVDAGKILIAGYLEFAMNMPTHSYTLVGSFTNPQGLFDSLSQADKDTLGNFTHNGAADAGSTNPD